MVSLVVGTGIFAAPVGVAKNLSNPFLYFSGWLFGGIISLCGALTFEEIGSRYPSTEGIYKTFSFCFHTALAFRINWVLVISNAAAVAPIVAEFVMPIGFPETLQNETGIRIVSITSVSTLYVINLQGIKLSVKTRNIRTLFKTGMILILCSSVFIAQLPL